MGSWCLDGFLVLPPVVVRSPATAILLGAPTPRRSAGVHKVNLVLRQSHTPCSSRTDQRLVSSGLPTCTLLIRLISTLACLIIQTPPDVTLSGHRPTKPARSPPDATESFGSSFHPIFHSPIPIQQVTRTDTPPQQTTTPKSPTTLSPPRCSKSTRPNRHLRRPSPRDKPSRPSSESPARGSPSAPRPTRRPGPAQTYRGT